MDHHNMNIVEINWKMAFLLIYHHARISVRLSASIFCLITLLVWCVSRELGYSLDLFWQNYMKGIILFGAWVHFFPVNIYAIHRLAKNGFANGHHIVILVPQGEEKKLSIKLGEEKAA